MENIILRNLRSVKRELRAYALHAKLPPELQNLLNRLRRGFHSHGRRLRYSQKAIKILDGNDHVLARINYDEASDMFYVGKGNQKSRGSCAKCPNIYSAEQQTYRYVSPH